MVGLPFVLCRARLALRVVQSDRGPRRRAFDYLPVPFYRNESGFRSNARVIGTSNPLTILSQTIEPQYSLSATLTQNMYWVTFGGGKAATKAIRGYCQFIDNGSARNEP